MGDIAWIFAYLKDKSLFQKPRINPFNRYKVDPYHQT